MEKQFTVKDIARHLGVEDVEAYGFLRVMMKHEAIAKVGTRKQASGRGKPTNLYTFSSEKAQTLIFEKLPGMFV